MRTNHRLLFYNKPGYCPQCGGIMNPHPELKVLYCARCFIGDFRE